LKTVYGLFASYRDARAAIEEFHRQGFAELDVSAVLRSGPPDASSRLAVAASPRRGKQRRDRKKGERALASGEPDLVVPRAFDARPATGSELDPVLPGGKLIDVGGIVTLTASGRLAAAFDQADVARQAPVDLKNVLASLGLPAGYTEIYAKGVNTGQTLLAVRTPDDRERDVVTIMRRHSVASLGGLPE
jgi:hypothetical protein